MYASKRIMPLANNLCSDTPNNSHWGNILDEDCARGHDCPTAYVYNSYYRYLIFLYAQHFFQII